MLELVFELPELGVVAGFHAQNGSAEDQQFTHNADGATGNLSQRRDEEQTHHCNNDPAAEAGHRNAALQAREFHMFPLSHHLLVVSYQICKDERVVACVIKAGSAGSAGEHAVLDVSLTHTIHAWIVLVPAATEWQICRYIRREVIQTTFPCRIPIRIGTSGVQHMKEHPVFKLDKARVITPPEIVVFGSSLEPGLRSLDGIAGAAQHSVEREDVDGDFTLIIEVGELLDAQRILVLYPAFEHSTAAVIPDIAVTVMYVTKTHENAGNGAAVNAQGRDVDFQYVCSLVLRRLWIIGELRVQDYEILLLMGLESNLPGPEIIACGIEVHSRISRLHQAQRPR